MKQILNRRSLACSCTATLMLAGAVVCAAGATTKAEPVQSTKAAEPVQLTREQATRGQALRPENHSYRIQSTSELSPTRFISRGGETQPFKREERGVAAMRYEFEGHQYTVQDLFKRVHATGLVVLHDGKLVHEQYRPESNDRTHFLSYSMGKVFSSTLVALAIGDGSIKSVNDQLTQYIPELKGTAYEGVTIRNVLNMSSGVRWNEGYGVAGSDIVLLAKHVQIMQDQTIAEILKSLPRAAPPGTVFNYSTAESQMLVWVVKAATGKDPAKYFEERIWSRLGMYNDAAWALDHPLGMEVGGGGILATVRDYARFAQLFLNDGVWNGERILPKGWVAEATTPDEPQLQYGKLPWGEPEGYKYQWWPIPGPDKAFAAEGSYGQILYINPAKKLVIAMTSLWPKQWDQNLKHEAWAAYEAIGKQLARSK